MRVLVTGGAGFIGSVLVHKLLNDGHDVVVLDNLSKQIHGGVSPELVAAAIPSVRFVHSDVRDVEVLDALLAKVDSVVHLAAETGTGQSMYEISHYYDVNQQATAELFELIGKKHSHVKKVILASSRSIYGEGAYRIDGKLYIPGSRTKELLDAGEFEPLGPYGEPLDLVPTPEDVQPRPASIYAATKVANEDLGRIFAETFGTSVVALRFQNVFGEGQSLKNPYTGILSIFSNRMRQNLPIDIFEDGLESRDFVHVDDVTWAIGAALGTDLPGFNAINIGAGEARTVLDVATTLVSLLNSDSELNITGNYRLGDIRHCYADITLAKKLLNYSPRVSFFEGLERFCDWVQKQPIEQDKSAEALAALVGLGLGKQA